MPREQRPKVRFKRKIKEEVAHAWGVDAGREGADLAHSERPRLKVTSDAFSSLAGEYGREQAQTMGGFNPIAYDLDHARNSEEAWDAFDEGVYEGIGKWIDDHLGPLFRKGARSNPRMKRARR